MKTRQLRKPIFIFISLFVFMLVAAFLLLPLLHLFSRGNVGSINTISGWYWCTDESSCLHEQGHLLDYQNDWVSSTNEYRFAVSKYLAAEKSKPTLPSVTQLITPLAKLHPREAYAQIYVIFDGDPPDILAPFYQGYDHNFCIKLPRGKLCL